jgi:hypothetical protein
MTLKIGKNAVAAFRMQAVQLVFEECFEIHHMLQYRASVFCERTLVRQPFASALAPSAAKGP